MFHFTRLIILSFLVMTFSATGASTSSEVLFEGRVEGENLRLERIFKTDDIIWGFDFLSADQLILTEKSGALKLLSIKKNKATELMGLPKVTVLGQGGLLDIKKHPKYPTEPWIYITYAEAVGESQARTVLARFKIKDQKRVKNFEVLLRTESVTPHGQHFGSRIAFDDNGHLYFSVGDRGEREKAQSLSNHQGKILRLRLEGTVPSDNPFINCASAKPEIWTCGHRNPQGIIFDSKTKKIWAIEHGPRGGDELNLIQRGSNYGWPVVSFGREYHIDKPVGEAKEKPGMVSPVHQYTPSIAPSSLALYSGRLFKSWQGQFFAGALALTHLNKINLQADAFVSESRLFSQLGRRIRHVAESIEGEIYLATDQGELLKLSKSVK